MILVKCRNALLNLSIRKLETKVFYSNFKRDCDKMSFIFLSFDHCESESFYINILDALHKKLEKKMKNQKLVKNIGWQHIWQPEVEQY